jgi:hypothetical protein
MCWFSYRCCHFKGVWNLETWTLLAPFEQLTREISSTASAADVIPCHGIETPDQQKCQHRPWG